MSDHVPVLDVWSSEIFWFSRESPDSNLKMFCLLDLKLNWVIGHQQGYLAFEIGVHPFAYFGRLSILCFLNSNDDASTNQFETRDVELHLG